MVDEQIELKIFDDKKEKYQSWEFDTDFHIHLNTKDGNYSSFTSDLSGASDSPENLKSVVLKLIESNIKALLILEEKIQKLDFSVEGKTNLNIKF